MSGKQSNRTAHCPGLRFATAVAQVLMVAALAAPVAHSSPAPHHPAAARALTGRALGVAANGYPRRAPAPRCPLADRKTMQSVVRCFVQTAVTRRAPALGFDISTRGERAGLTRRQWATGNIPVPMVPSPTGQLRFGRGPGRPTPLAREYVVFVGTWAMLADLQRASRSAPWRIDYFQPFPFGFVPAP